MRILSIALFSALLACAAHDARCASALIQRDSDESLALSDDDVHRQVVTHLSSIDTPISAASWQALGHRAEPILREIIADTGNFPTYRAKAIDALSIVGGPGTAGVFREAAKSESEPLVVRYAAIRALAATVEPKSSRDELAGILSGAGDARVRAAAGEVMVKRDPAGACPLVQSQASREAQPRYFRRALHSCQGE